MFLINVYSYDSREFIDSIIIDRVPVKGDFIYINSQNNAYKVVALVFNNKKNEAYIDLGNTF